MRAINPELVRYDIETMDGHIGRIDESSINSGTDHLVVDTRSWTPEEKRPLSITRTRSSMPWIGIHDVPSMAPEIT